MPKLNTKTVSTLSDPPALWAYKFFFFFFKLIIFTLRDFLSTCKDPPPSPSVINIPLPPYPQNVDNFPFLPFP